MNRLKKTSAIKSLNLFALNSVAIVLATALTGCGSSEEIIEEPVIIVEPDDPMVIDLTTLSDGTQVSTEQLISLGELIYSDTNLSTPAGQSCASCHSLDTGFDDPNEFNPTSLGADGLSFGTRNSPTASYAAHIPERQIVNRPPAGGGAPRDVLIGGLFWDGRALNLEEQAKGPFLNPVEMGNADEAEVIAKIAESAYANDFEALFGTNIFNSTEQAYNYVADAIAAFERTEVFSPFTSKFDQVQNGTATFTAQEARGEQLFNGRAQCDRCHQTDEGAEMFSNFEYENIGVPSNPLLPAFIEDPSFVDLGLGAETNNANDNGKFRNPSLRNIADTAPYMHNGVFNTLEEVIDFYNTRDSGFLMPPEVNDNIDQGGNIGELGLNQRDIEDLVAFLQTLSDQ